MQATRVVCDVIHAASADPFRLTVPYETWHGAESAPTLSVPNYGRPSWIRWTLSRLRKNIDHTPKELVERVAAFVAKINRRVFGVIDRLWVKTELDPDGGKDAVLKVLAYKCAPEVRFPDDFSTRSWMDDACPPPSHRLQLR